MLRSAMDLGCLDLGCVSVSDKQSTDSDLNSQNKEADASESVSATSKVGKNKSLKEAGQSTLNALNKFTSQIKKPAHRKSSPLNWFPRKKVDSYLNRKIKMLQEVEGMNLTLDETLGDSNPHYSRVLREKMAVREAAHKAMEARKAALVEASWCRILKAARIQSKEAEALLLKAEKTAAEAFEAATAIGVIMYDIPNCPRNPCQVETSSANGGKSTTHTVTASFETAFEVDKEVAAAVKSAFIRLASCPSFNKDEFKELLRKISQNPDAGDGSNQELSASECESEPSESEFETVSHTDGFNCQELDHKMPVVETRNRKSKRRQSFEKLNRLKLVDMMLERLRCLHEDELSSLATIVATCGLNAALAEVENSKLHEQPSVSVLNFPRRMSSLGTARNPNLERKQADSKLPSLDKFLVKHVSKLEREVQEAKKTQKDESMDELKESLDKTSDGELSFNSHVTAPEPIPDLGSILVKHYSRLEKEIEETKRNHGKAVEISRKKLGRSHGEDVTVPSLDKFLVKHVSRLEKQVQEAKSRRNNEQVGKENFDLNKHVHGNSETKCNEREDSLDRILVKPVHRLEREKAQAQAQALSRESSNGDRKQQQKNQGRGFVMDCESLDKVLVKRVCRLEKEKMSFNANEEVVKVKKGDTDMHSKTNEEGGLDQILVKHKSRLEREKMGASDQHPGAQIKSSMARRQERERELQEAWGGLSLGNSIRPHLSKLERDKAAWIKAEEEERRQKL